MNRRNFFQQLTQGAALAGLACGGGRAFAADQAASLTPKLSPLKITKVKAILTAPARIRLCVVKVETSEPGLYGLGCATFTQRIRTVATAVNEYLAPFLAGKDADNIEDLWQAMYQSSYWRNGPVLMNALSGVDAALWDIKGKRAGMPLYQLLGGKVRHGADCYYHASGANFTEVEDSARRGMALGFRHVRVQAATPGLAGYGAGGGGGAAATAARNDAIGPTNPRAIWEPAPYVRMVPKLFEHLRTKLGDEVELLHDVHERITLNQAINMCKALEPYRLFFLEDPFPPEENDHFRLLRQQTGQRISSRVYHGHGIAGGGQIIGELAADQTAAQNRDLFYGRERATEFCIVGKIVHRQHCISCIALQRQAYRVCPHCQYQALILDHARRC